MGKRNREGKCPVCNYELPLGAPTKGTFYAACPGCHKCLRCTGYPSDGFQIVATVGLLDILCEADCRKSFFDVGRLLSILFRKKK